jgi:DNA polymerase
MKLSDIREKVRKCRLCRLCEEANNSVPGEGSENAEIFFIGEAPGKKEDEMGMPFVGAAGKFLTEMLNACKIDRKDVFITNVVKHRPPGNRDPLPDEISSCFPFLQEQIDAIRPKVIVLLGRHALNRFLPDLRISDVHGSAMRAKGPFAEKHIFFPVYHPASALYNPKMRDTLIKDMKKLPVLLKKIQKNVSS